MVGRLLTGRSRSRAPCLDTSLYVTGPTDLPGRGVSHGPMAGTTTINYSPPLGSKASCAQVLPVGPFSRVAMSVKLPAPAHPLMMTATIAEMSNRMSYLANDLSNRNHKFLCTDPIVLDHGRKMEGCHGRSLLC